MQPSKGNMCFSTFEIFLEKVEVESQGVGKCSMKKDGFSILEAGRKKSGSQKSKSERTTKIYKEKDRKTK